MAKWKQILATAALWLGLLFVLCTLISLLYSTSHWFIQVFHFPRLQALWILAACLLVYVSIQQRKALVAVVVAMSAAIVINAWHLFPYTRFANMQVAPAAAHAANNSRVSLLVANVFMNNRQYQAFVSLVQQHQPTLLLAMEVNSQWIDQLNVLRAQYPYTMLYPASNTYGMALYSKLPLHNSKVLFFNHDSVPAFLTQPQLAGGQAFQLLTVHPVAPKSSTHPDNVNNKEVGLLKAAYTVQNATLPVVVAGDFNDVGWSPNTRQFEKISGLKDTRQGRGLFNTFSAHNIFMRWPLDHVYTSGHFRVAALQRLPAFGSDHFPLLVTLELSPASSR